MQTNVSSKSVQKLKSYSSFKKNFLVGRPVFAISDCDAYDC